MSNIVVDADAQENSAVVEDNTKPITDESVDIVETVEAQAETVEPTIQDKFAGKSTEDIIDSYTNLEKLYNNLDSIESKKDLWFAKGQLSILRQVIGLEDTTKRAVEELDVI